MTHGKNTPSRKTATAAKAQQGATVSTSTPATSTVSVTSTASVTSPASITSTATTTSTALATETATPSASAIPSAVSTNQLISELITKLDAFFTENAALRKRNDELASRIETLERRLAEKPELPSTDSSTAPAPVDPVDLAPKKKYDALILSDSILRHVGGDCPPKKPTAVPPEKLRGEWFSQDLPYVAPKPYKPLLVKKIVAPGARAAKLYNLARGLAKDFSFEHVVVHVGTNYVLYDHQDDNIEEVNDLLAELKTMFNCRITFSPILP